MTHMDSFVRSVLDLSPRVREVSDFVPALGRLLGRSDETVSRLFVSVQSLHPVFRARTYLWYAGWDAAEVKSWPHGLANRPGYEDSPDYHVHRSKRPFRIRLSEPIPETRCDFYGSLKREEFTDYFMVPLRFSDGTVNTLSFATRDAAGFTPALIAAFGDLVPALTAVLERLVASQIVSSTLAAYLGRSASRHVLNGSIQAGRGEILEAIILFGDLHSYTSVSATLSPAETVALLNDYFDCIVEPVEGQGGHVLKFIGDAFLAFFPLEDDAEPLCAEAALKAIHDIRGRLSGLNKKRAAHGLCPLSHGVAVHFGEVVYGNVGSRDRLDFTIIGQEVNLAWRVQRATKSLGVDYLFTGAYVAAFGKTGLVPLGPLELKELGRTVDLYTLPETEQSL